MKKPQPEPRCAPENCACNKCFKAKPENEVKAAKFWQDLYKRMGWPKDELGYL